jgi:type IV secretory pathway VirB10-like protein
MADPVNEAVTSPDYLSTTLKRGSGVRRLNRVPVFIVTGILSLVMAVVGYTMYQKRGSQTQGIGAASKDQGDPTPSAADPQVLKGAQDRGVIAAAAPAPLTDDVQIRGEGDPSRRPPEMTPVPGVPSGSASAAGGSPRDEVAEQWRQRMQQIQFQRLDDRIKALQSDTAIEAKVHDEGQATDNGGVNPTTSLNAAISRATQQINDASTLASGPLGGNNAGSPGRGGLNAPNGQTPKRDFLKEEPVGGDTLQHGRVAPISPYEVKAGTVIPANMIGGVNSDLPGLLLAQVSENMYDSATGRHLLIPQGAKLIGTYDNGVTFGQSRILVGWQRIIYPDGSSINLGRMPGADQSGYAGFKDKVDNHLFRLFSEALLLSIFSAGVQLGQPQASSGNNYNSSQIVAAAIAGQMGELGMEIVRRNMDVAPSLEIRPGYSFNVMVTKDMVVRPWEAGDPSVANVSADDH